MSSKSKDSTSKFDMTALGENYEPTNFDVICARGRIAVNHPGNRRFKLIVENSLQRYSDAPSKLAKSAIVSDIVDTIRKSSRGGGFIKKEGKMWYEAGDHLAREKVGQCLRDQLHSKYRSSTKAKKLSRKVKQSMLVDEVDQIMNRSSYQDITQRVQELTKNARRDSDFQKAFNQANLELLKTFKDNPLPTEFWEAEEMMTTMMATTMMATTTLTLTITMMRETTAMLMTHLRWSPLQPRYRIGQQ